VDSFGKSRQVVIDRNTKKGLIERRYGEFPVRIRCEGGRPLNEKIIKFAAAGFGSGYAPLAPGTAGSLVGIPLYLAFSALPWPIWLLTITALTCLAWYLSEEAEKLFGRKDAPCIVIDEIAGLQWTLFLVAPTVLHTALGFVLFRLFDVLKPFPARFFQKRLPGGYGVVADDLAAAVYAAAVLHVLMRFGGM
jgi:phosphatidylglycerophosphatase A